MFLSKKANLTLPESTRALLNAVSAISSDLDLRSVLSRIVEAAADLTDAQYGALGVIGDESALAEFAITGLAEEEAARIGDTPRGHGILGLLIRDPKPIRLDDLTKHPAATGFPPGHPPMGSFLGVPVRIRGTVFGNLYLTEKSGGRSFTKEDELLVDALADAAGFVIENARAYGLSERRRQWLEAAADLDEVVQPPVDLDSALRQVVRLARNLARADAVAAARPGSPPQIATHRPEIHDDAAEVLRQLLADPAIARTPVPVAAAVNGYDAFAVPLRTHLAGSGLLVALHPRGTGLLQIEDRELFVSFAEHASLSLDRAQGINDRAMHAVTADRERIARDLHDVVIQRLFATGLHLQRAEMLAVLPGVAEQLRVATDSLDETIRDIRGTIFELQHHDTGGSLRAELRELVHEYAPLLGFEPVTRTTGPVDSAVPPEIREQLLPVLREALSNLARHAAAKHGEVEVTVTGEEVRLTVLDDGVGIGPTTRESGLRNARRRATELGGQLEVTRRDPQGTSFAWRVPLPGA